MLKFTKIIFDLLNLRLLPCIFNDPIVTHFIQIIFNRVAYHRYLERLEQEAVKDKNTQDETSNDVRDPAEDAISDNTGDAKVAPIEPQKVKEPVSYTHLTLPTKA